MSSDENQRTNQSSAEQVEAYEGIHVVVGGEKALGRAVVDALLADSKDVKVVTLESPGHAFPQGVEVVEASPQQTQVIADECREAFIVYDCFEPTYSEWKKSWPEVTSNILVAAIDARVTMIVSSPIVASVDENQRVEEEILRAHGGGLTRTAVVRTPQLYGNRVLNPLWRQVYESAIEGKKAHWVGDLDVKRTLLDVDDAARAMVKVGRSPWALGKSWSVASPRTLSGREFIELAFEASGNPPKVGKWGRGIVLTGSILAGESRSIIEMPYDYYSSFVLDAREFSEAFPDFSYTPPEKSMAKAIGWYRAQMATVGA